jgi:Fe-S-cluster containining protein
MELSEIDTKKLEEAGYSREEFSSVGVDGINRLRNLGEFCFFYDSGERRCRVYGERPLGCQIYPIMFSVDDDALVVDDLCPMRATVSKNELEAKGLILKTLLKTIDSETEARLRIAGNDLE